MIPSMKPSRGRRAARAILAIAAAALTCAGAQAAAQEGSAFTLGGTAEARPFARYSGSFAGGPGGFDWAGMSYGQATSLGLELAASGTRARAAASIEAALLTGAAAADAWAAAGALGAGTAGLLVAPAYVAGPAPATLLEARVRTLYVKLDYDWFSLTAGRQVVKFARGAIWNPTDPFTELDLSGISPVRRGSDALRLSFPLGATGAFDLVAAPSPGFSTGRYAARLSGLLGGVDGALLASRDGAAGAWSLGMDFKADLILGFDGSALYTLPDSGGASLGSGYLRAAGGADYSFGDFVAAAQYCYNGGGASADPNASGSHNAFLSLSWRASDFLSLTASLIDGLSSGSWSATLAASLDAAQNAALAAYCRLLRSPGPEPWLAEAGLSIKVSF
jgi:hypothetical protein